MGGHHIRRLIAYPSRPLRNPCVVARLARFGLYHILQVTDPVRGRMELRYVRHYPEPLTVQFPLFEPLACAVPASAALEKGRLPRRRAA